VSCGTATLCPNGLLGAGRHARVYRGELQLPDSTVAHCAVKVAGDGREAAEHCRIEAERLGAIRSPDVVRMLGHAPGIVVLELAAGTLASRALTPDRPLLMDEIIAHARSLFRALDALHAAGHAHLDVKPHNVLLRTDGAAVLADFGGAQPLGALLVAPGTTSYVAPETLALRDPPAVAASMDVYAAGAVLYVLLTGREPFAGPGDRPPRPCTGHARCFSAPEPMAAPGADQKPLEGVMLLLAVRAGFFVGGRNPWRFRGDVVGDRRLQCVVALAERCLDRDARLRPTTRDALLTLSNI
jgi:serine/threonine protein kinase